MGKSSLGAMILEFTIWIEPMSSAVGGSLDTDFWKCVQKEIYQYLINITYFFGDIFDND